MDIVFIIMDISDMDCVFMNMNLSASIETKNWFEMKDILNWEIWKRPKRSRWIFFYATNEVCRGWLMLLASPLWANCCIFWGAVKPWHRHVTHRFFVSSWPSTLHFKQLLFLTSQIYSYVHCIRCDTIFSYCIKPKPRVPWHSPYMCWGLFRSHNIFSIISYLMIFYFIFLVCRNLCWQDILQVCL